MEAIGLELGGTHNYLQVSFSNVINFDEKLMWLMISIGLLCGVIVPQRYNLGTIWDSCREKKHSDQC